MSNNAWHVLQHDVSGSNLTNDPGDGWPEPTFIVSSGALARGGEGLAGKSGSDEIHASTPRCTVEGFKVIPDRSLIQPRLAHPGHESGRCVGVPLNVSHGAGVSVEGEVEPAVSGAEMQGT